MILKEFQKKVSGDKTVGKLIRSPLLYPAELQAPIIYQRVFDIEYLRRVGSQQYSNACHEAYITMYS